MVRDRGAHFFGGAHVDEVNACGRFQRRRAADQDYFGAPAGGRFRQRISHFSGRAIRQIAHRVKVFAGGAGGDQHGLSRKILLAVQNCFYRGDDFSVSGQAPGTHHSAREIAFVRLHDVHAALFQQRNVRARGRMIPHVHIHRGSHDHRRGGGQIQSAQKIVRNPAREFRDDVRGGGNYQQQIGALRHGNVFNRAFEVGFVRRSCRINR